MRVFVGGKEDVFFCKIPGVCKWFTRFGFQNLK